MRYKLIGTACVALLIGGGIANAKVDFDDLLSTISFSDPQSPADQDQPERSEELPAPVPQLPQLAAPLAESDDTIERLLPNVDSPSDVPEVTANEFSFDDADAEMDLLSDDSLRAIPELPNNSITPYNLDTPYSLQDSGNYQESIGQQPQPLPYAPIVPGSESVDMETLVNNFTPSSDANCGGPISVLECGNMAGPVHNPLFQQCGYGVHGCAGPCAGKTPQCLPAPVLPPAADVNAMYRTPSWYRGLWAGYAEQKQLELSHQPHLIGTCDCARNSQCNCNRRFSH